MPIVSGPRIAADVWPLLAPVGSKAEGTDSGAAAEPFPLDESAPEPTVADEGPSGGELPTAGPPSPTFGDPPALVASGWPETVATVLPQPVSRAALTTADAVRVRRRRTGISPVPGQQPELRESHRAPRPVAPAE